jgi:glycosyltransferase involved in cell wall biosynthesis
MAEQRRALIVDLARRFGGASARALGLLEAMPTGLGALVCLEHTPLHDQAAARGLQAYAVARHKADPRIVPRLLCIVRAGGYHVLDTQNAQSKFWSALVATRADVALVSTLNSWYESEHRGGFRGRLYQAIERRTAAATDLYIAVSGEIRDRLTSENAPEEAVALIPNAIRLDPASVIADKPWLVSSLELPSDARVLCAVGRLVEAKCHEDLIDAVAALGDPALHCLIVGEGRLRSKLAAQIARLGLDRRVHLLGHRQPSEVLRIVKASDVFVMPSSTEGTPIALLEAAALGRPIVATRVGGIPELLTHGVHALLVDPRDPAVLAKALGDVLADTESALDIGRRAQEHVASRFGIAAQVEATMQAYDRAWARRQRRR